MSIQPLLQQVAKSLGSRIRQLRKKKGLAQGEFAVLCDLHRSHMGKIERGETNVRLSTLLAISQNLETTVERLLSESLPLISTEATDEKTNLLAADLR